MKRTNRKRIRCKEAADMIGCSTKTVKRNFETTPMTPGKKTTPRMVMEAEIKAYIERLEA